MVDKVEDDDDDLVFVVNQAAAVNEYYSKFQISSYNTSIPATPYIKRIRKIPKHLPAHYVPPNPELLQRLAKASRTSPHPSPVLFADDSTPLKDNGDPFKPAAMNENRTEWQKGTLVLPAETRWMNTDLSSSNLDYVKENLTSHRFSLVLIDPPWENKSVRRARSYQTYHHTRLLELTPLIDACATEWIAVWVTNKPAFREFILNTLFRAWNCEYICTHYWLKVAQNGQLVTPLESTHRLPYEQLMVGRIGGTSSSTRSCVIKSIPIRHSWKPPIDMLFPHHCSKLELFARELRPQWTSIGNQVRCCYIHENCQPTNSDVDN